MAPLYAGYKEDFQLHSDDIRGIQLLYGKKTGTTAAPPSRTTEKPKDKDCSPRFHATVQGSDHYLYAFNGDRVYKIGDTGLKSILKIDDVFPQAPHDIDAAFKFPETGQIALLKGARLWLYNGFKLDPSYPVYLDVEHFRERPVAAISAGGKVNIFGNRSWWSWDPKQRRVSRSNIGINTRYTNMPDFIDSLLNWKDGYTYAFKENKYYKIREYGWTGVVERGYPRDIGPAWFGKQCGHSPK